LLTEREWIQIKQFLKNALGFLSTPQPTITTQRLTVIDPDADPRNANWLRIDSACRLAHRALPTWAAMWLWQLRTDTSPSFWRRVGRIAEQLGYPKLTSDEPRMSEETGKVQVILEVGTAGGSLTLVGVRSAQGWRFESNLMTSLPN
jgi:hypothetical protein